MALMEKLNIEQSRETGARFSTVESSEAAFHEQLDYFTISDWRTYIRIMIRRFNAEHDEDQKGLILKRIEMSLM